jgi:hypothetical protein
MSSPSNFRSRDKTVALCLFRNELDYPGNETISLYKNRETGQLAGSNQSLASNI